MTVAAIPAGPGWPRWSAAAAASLTLHAATALALAWLLTPERPAFRPETEARLEIASVEAESARAREDAAAGDRAPAAEGDAARAGTATLRRERAEPAALPSRIARPAAPGAAAAPPAEPAARAASSQAVPAAQARAAPADAAARRASPAAPSGARLAAAPPPRDAARVAAAAPTAGAAAPPRLPQAAALAASDAGSRRAAPIDSAAAHAPARPASGEALAAGAPAAAALAGAAPEAGVAVPAVPDVPNLAASVAAGTDLAAAPPRAAPAPPARADAPPAVPLAGAGTPATPAARTGPSLAALAAAPGAEVRAAAPAGDRLAASEGRSPVAPPAAAEPRAAPASPPRPQATAAARADGARAAAAPPPAAPSVAAEPPAAAAPPAAPAGLASAAGAGLAWSGDLDERLSPASAAAIRALLSPEAARPSGPPLRDGLDAMLDAVPCSRLEAALDPATGVLSLRGHAPDRATGEAARASVEARLGGAMPVAADLAVLPRPQCGVLDALEALGLPQSTDQADDPLALGRQAEAARASLHDGQLLRIEEMEGADYPAYLHLDVYDSGGTVTHLAPNEVVPLRRFGAEEVVSFGWERDYGSRLRVEIGPPYGVDLLVIVATSAPLSDTLRPIREPAGAYLAWLDARLAALRAADPDFRGEWVHVTLETRPAP